MYICISKNNNSGGIRLTTLEQINVREMTKSETKKETKKSNMNDNKNEQYIHHSQSASKL